MSRTIWTLNTPAGPMRFRSWPAAFDAMCAVVESVAPAVLCAFGDIAAKRLANCGVAGVLVTQWRQNLQHTG